METWLESLANNKEIWTETDELDMFPPMIVNDYIVFREAVSKGDVYKTILSSKDLYETLIKIPVIMSLVILSHDYNTKQEPKVQQEIQSIFASTLKLPLSIGTWSTLAKEIGEKAKNISIPQSLKDILKHSRQLFLKKVSSDFPTIESWRNNVIGHGKIACSDDESHREPIESIIRNVNSYFGLESVRCAYLQIFFLQNEKAVQGDTVFLSDADTIWIMVEGKKYDVSNFVLNIIQNESNKIGYSPLLFESYYSRKKSTKYLDYYSGIWKMSNNQYFRFLYESIGFSEADIRRNRQAVTQNEDELLRSLTSGDYYFIPDKLTKRIEEVAETIGKGIITVFMERGTGKTALADHMDSRYESDEIFPYWVIRTYHIRDISFRSEADFYSAINIAFSITSNGKYVRLQEDVRISRDSNTSKEDMAKLLNAYHHEFCNLYTIKSDTLHLALR